MLFLCWLDWKSCKEKKIGWALESQRAKNGNKLPDDGRLRTRNGCPNGWFSFGFSFSHPSSLSPSLSLPLYLSICPRPLSVFILTPPLHPPPFQSLVYPLLKLTFVINLLSLLLLGYSIIGKFFFFLLFSFLFQCKTSHASEQN